MASLRSVPRHVAIIMDGNGRWAKTRGLPRIKGHEQGAQAVRECVEACGDLKIEYLTLYAFSAENWQRPKSEVFALMRLLEKFLKEKTPRSEERRVGKEYRSTRWPRDWSSDVCSSDLGQDARTSPHQRPRTRCASRS